jgi:hypothetical protein
MKYTVIYTKTYSVDIEANNEDHAVELWEDMDLDEHEHDYEPAELRLQSVCWDDANGQFCFTEY